MRKLATVLGVLGALMALAAAFLSYKLFEARTDFVTRADKLSSTVQDIVKTLDKDSATNVATKTTFTPADRATGTPEKGTLGRVAFKGAKAPDGSVAAYDKTLAEAKTLATKINDQRNELAGKLAEIAGTFGLQDVTPEDLKSADTQDRYMAAAGRVADHCRAIRVRDEAMIKTVVSTSTTIKHPVDEKAFAERATATDENGKTVYKDFGHSQPLADLATNVTNLFTRAGDYAKTLNDSVDQVDKYTWQVDKTQIPSETEYAGALTAITGDYDGINNELKKFEICRTELETTKKKLENTVIDLEKKEKLLATTEQARDRLEAEVKRLEAIVGKPGAPGSAQQGFVFDPNLEGRVLQVNRDWNFVILNLGAKNVHTKMPLLVARGDKFIARLEVTSVFKNVCVAEILPEIQSGQIEAADKVILPKDVLLQHAATQK